VSSLICAGFEMKCVALAARAAGLHLLAQLRCHNDACLIVDDSPICHKVLEKALQAQGYDTDTACDGCDKLLFDPCAWRRARPDETRPRRQICL
jgi:hypothetical protein